MIPDGIFPAVALSVGMGTLAVRQGDPRVPGWLVVYRFPAADPDALSELVRVGLPAGSPCFPNLYDLDGLTWLAFHDGQQQRLLNMVTHAEERFAGLSNPSAFGAGHFAYTEPVEPYRVHRINLRTAEVDQPRLGAPTGLSRILDDGRVVTIDEDRHALLGATIPSFAGPLVVGERPNGGAVWTHTSGAQGVLYAGLDSFTPKCAADGDTLAITTAGSGSVRLFCGTLAALVAASQAEPEKKPDPLVHPPAPAPEVPPVSVPLPAHVFESVTRYVARFPVPQKATPGNADEAFEDVCRGWCVGLAEQVQFDARDPRWGVKSAGGGRPQSKDSLTFNGPRLINYDLLLGVGTGRPTLNLQAVGEDITGQHFIPVTGVNHLGGVVTPPPVEQPPVPPVDPSPLVAQLAVLGGIVSELRAVVVELSKKVEALDAASRVHRVDILRLIDDFRSLQKPPSYRVVGRTSRTYGHAHDLDVRLEPV